jgi:hypothetical protein
MLCSAKRSQMVTLAGQAGPVLLDSKFRISHVGSRPDVRLERRSAPPTDQRQELLTKGTVFIAARRTHRRFRYPLASTLAARKQTWARMQQQTRWVWRNFSLIIEVRYAAIMRHTHESALISKRRK